MEEKKYPRIEEEESTGMCSEPEVGCYVTGGGYTNTMAERHEEAEVFIAQAEKGDWSNWVTENQSRANLYSKYPWLR